MASAQLDPETGPNRLSSKGRVAREAGDRKGCGKSGQGPPALLTELCAPPLSR